MILSILAWDAVQIKLSQTFRARGKRAMLDTQGTSLFEEGRLETSRSIEVHCSEEYRRATLERSTFLNVRHSQRKRWQKKKNNNTFPWAKRRQTDGSTGEIVDIAQWEILRARCAQWIIEPTGCEQKRASLRSSQTKNRRTRRSVTPPWIVRLIATRKSSYFCLRCRRFERRNFYLGSTCTACNDEQCSAVFSVRILLERIELQRDAREIVIYRASNCGNNELPRSRARSRPRFRFTSLGNRAAVGNKR